MRTDEMLQVQDAHDRQQEIVKTLLAALQNLVPRFERCCRHAGNSDEVIADATADARAAIAKATKIARATKP